MTVLVLLPPSETKAVGTDGPPLDLDDLSFPLLNPVRKKLVIRLASLAKRQRAALAKALDLSPGQRGEIDKDALLLTAPTLPTMELYSGIVYDNLDYTSLTGTAKKRADSSLVVASALFGLLRPEDRVPSYRLSGSTVLPGTGGLAGLWRPVLEPALAEHELVVDLRSGAYVALARVPHAVTVRVLRDEAGRRTVVSHDNKWTKGQFARALCLEPATDVSELAEIGRTVCDDVEVSVDGGGNRIDLLLHGLASAR
ncbi:MAG: hypothetical protein JWM40_3073 [Frankiales bacterium]|nr:hypothetical protein [Frankiales bacterium]